jgi:hypothetical protein
VKGNEKDYSKVGIGDVMLLKIQFQLHNFSNEQRAERFREKFFKMRESLNEESTSVLSRKTRAKDRRLEQHPYSEANT